MQHSEEPHLTKTESASGTRPSCPLAVKMSLKPVPGDCIANIWFPKGTTGDKIVSEPFQIVKTWKIGTDTK